MPTEVQPVGRPREGTPTHVAAVRYATADRFGLPEPAGPWDGVVRPGPSPLPPQVAEEPRVVPGMAADGPIDEACLNLDVWTPSLDGRRPVLVWIPGGAYLGGGAAMPTYDGSRLAADGDVVVVGVTYRVGALGFLAADGVPANLGLRDVRTALVWIRRHIADLGGDPDRVVAMGESAGAGVLAHLLTDPDLPIHGAIVQSGSPGSALAPEVAAQVTATLLAEAGVESVDHLRSLPVADLLAAQTRACAALESTVGKMPFHPIVDGDVVRANPLDAARAGALTAVPLVVGTTAHELELYRAELDAIPAEYGPFVLARSQGALGLDPDALARGLAATGGDLGGGVADLQLHLPAFVFAESQARRGISSWRYSFTWEAPGRRACHALDLPFTFGTLDVDDWRAFAGADGGRAPAADQLSARMRAAWTTFARDLVPACEPVGPWPEHTPTARPVVELGDEVAVTDDPDRERRGAWMGEPTS